MERFHATDTSAVQLSVRVGAAAGLSTAVAQWLSLPFPLYAMIAAVIVTDLSPVATRELALRRLAGTVLGASLGAVIIMALGPVFAASPWVCGLGVLTTMLLSHLLRLKDAAKIAGYICGIVLLDHGAHPWNYALARLVETVLGIVVAVVVSFIPKLLKVDVDQS